MRLKDSQSWISKTLESSYNTPEATGSNYAFIPTQNPFFMLPSAEKVSDANRVGRNFASHLCATYWTHPEVGIQDDVETDVPARLFRRGLGGSVTDTVVSAGAVWDHTFPMLNPQIGVDLPSFSIATLLGAASYLFSGCRVDSYRVSQEGSNRVQYEAGIVGSGKFANPHGLTSLPGLAAPPCMDGHRTEVSYVDPAAATVNLHTLGTLVSWFVELQNNLRRNKRRPGDPILTVGSNGAAAHVRSMPLGQERAVNIGLKLDFNDLTQWTNSIENATCTNLKFKVVGPIITGAYRHEFEIIVPSFSFEVVTPDEDEGDAAQTLNVIPFQDAVSAGAITGRIRNGVATLV
jgi:hypothetical protein